MDDEYYAHITVYKGMVNGKPKYVNNYLHSFILDIVNTKRVDHKDGNRLNNRKNNLRKGTPRGNSTNRHKVNKNNKSGYRNVSWSNIREKWVVQLQINGKNKALGKFVDKDEAGCFAKLMREKYYGECAGE